MPIEAGWNLPGLQAGPRLIPITIGILNALSYPHILTIPIAIGMQLAKFLQHLNHKQITNLYVYEGVDTPVQLSGLHLVLILSRLHPEGE